MSDDECGTIQGNGDPCDNSIKYADGKCGIHTDETESRQGGAKFNDSRAQDVINAAKDGLSIRGCERAAGLGEGTLRGWLGEDYTYKTEDGLVANFSRSFAQAREQSEREFIRRGFEDPDVDASFAKFMLASSFGYVKTEKQEHTGEGGGPMQISFSEEVVTTEWEPDE